MVTPLFSVSDRDSDIGSLVRFNNPLIVEDPLWCSRLRSLTHQSLRQPDVGECLLSFQTVQEPPNRRVAAGEHGVEPVVPSFSDVRGSWDKHQRGVVLVPHVVTEVRSSSRGSDPGVLVVEREGSHVRRKERLQVSPGSVHVVLRYEGDRSHHGEVLSMEKYSSIRSDCRRCFSKDFL